MINRLNAPLVLVGPIHLVLTNNVVQKSYEKKKRYPYLPNPDVVLRDLQELNGNGGVPAIIHKERDGTERLFLYTSYYCLALYESLHRDGYTIGFIDPLNLQHHERLSKGALRIQAQSWNLYQEVREIPRGSQNFWDTIYARWQQFEHARQLFSPETKQEDLTHAHEHFLAMLEDLIEMTHHLEQAKENLNAGIPYVKIEAAGEIRDTLRDIYVFRLAVVPQLNEKNMLCIKGEGLSDLRGRVVELEGAKLTLRFENKIDIKRLPKQGQLVPMGNPVVYKKQREALGMLREQEGKNPFLLRVLVDQLYYPYQPAPVRQENDEDLQLLTPEQFEAFQRALTVPDLLMVLGPPGTGKTRTITEIARYSGYQKQRVLMTSGTHKAVDNVLERMPQDLIVIRVGHENNISEKMRPKMIDIQAEKLQRVLLEHTDQMNYRYARIHTYKNEVDTMVRQLTQGHEILVPKEAHLNLLHDQQNIIEKRLAEPYRPKSEELNASLQALQKRVSRLQKRINVWSKSRTTNEERSHLLLIGWIFLLLLNYSTSRLKHTQQKEQDKQQEISALQEEINTHNQTIKSVLLADPEYQQYERQIIQLKVECDKVWKDFIRISRDLQATIVDPVPGKPDLTIQGATTIQHYLSWFNAARALLGRKSQLLKDWRAELGARSEQLYPELLRYADVVGATCIGAATAKGLEAVDFDLAIVDEAGQIGLPDLLVPLVRAKRAVLVGDHQQLPPFVDSEVQNFLKGAATHDQSLGDAIEDEAEVELMTEMLTKSAFERLFTARPDRSHLVTFTMQGRMPRAIADFASRHFYENRLGTFSDDKMQHTRDADPLFRHPLTVIDISNAPDAIKWEKQQRSLENLGESGYTNIAEAMIIAQIAEVYQRTNKEWVVIVPYRAQARLIIQELEKRIEAHDFSLAERVATVDSFQGGERKKVIYGFTRSNDRGKIGFLKELRRLNVAMTRAQQHLILVGNFSTLTRADDPRFRAVLSDLHTYASQRGEILSYDLCQRRVHDILEGRTVR